MFTTPTNNKHFAFIADENDTILKIKLTLIFFKFVKSNKKNTTIIPMQFNKKQITTNKKLIINNKYKQHNLFENQHKTGMDAFRHTEVQRGEYQSKVVNAHIAKTAGAEIPPP